MQKKLGTCTKKALKKEIDIQMHFWLLIILMIIIGTIVVSIKKTI